MGKKDILKTFTILKEKREIKVEEIFLDDFLKKQKDQREIKERKLETPLKKKVFFIFLVFSLAILGIIWIKTFDLQIRKYQKYYHLSEKNKFINLKIKAQRGTIYDRNMQPLTFNNVRFDVFLKKSEFFRQANKKEELLGKISKILKKPITELKEKIEKTSDDFIKIATNISHQELIFLETILKELPGIQIKKIIQRKYLEENGLSHILGYLGKISAKELENFSLLGYSLNDYIGKEGIEKEYESVLREKKGVLEIERDVYGKEIAKKIKKNPRSGKNLILTLDLSLQKKVAQSLKKTIKEVGSKGAAAIILNPQTGEVLASVSFPDFDNNLFGQGITKEQFQKLNQDPTKPQINRVIGGVYPVGSVIKPLLALAALEEEIITKKTKLFCPLALCLKNKYTQKKECFFDWKFHGWSDVKKAISQSVNPFFYIIGGGYQRPEFADQRLPKKFKGLGIKKIKKYLNLFGWGEKTGIDLPGEIKGIVPDPDWKKKFFKNKNEKKWYLGDTYNLSIGQGYLSVTPVQVAIAFSALINGGKVFSPKITKAILDSTTGEKKELIPKIKRKLSFSQKNIFLIKEGMRQAVNTPQGSAFLLNSLPVKVAAKTGTAQIGKKGIYHNWIVVFAPYENPKILLVIIIEKVKGKRIIAQKVAQEILEWYFGKSNS